MSNAFYASYNEWKSTLIISIESIRPEPSVPARLSVLKMGS